MAKNKKVENKDQKIIQMALDTNIIIYLFDYNKDPKFLRNNIRCLEDYYSIKYLDKIIKEDWLKNRFKRIYFSYSPIVIDELINHNPEKYDMKILTYARKYELKPFGISEKEAKKYKYLFNILMGENSLYQEYYNKPLFEDQDLNDCRIMAQSGINNLPLITMNKKHYIGIDGSIKKSIKERFEACNGYAGLVCKDSEPLTINEFIQKNFPEEYVLMQEEISTLINRKEVNTGTLKKSNDLEMRKKSENLQNVLQF